jgi:hypothetical protein
MFLGKQNNCPNPPTYSETQDKFKMLQVLETLHLMCRLIYL